MQPAYGFKDSEKLELYRKEWGSMCFSFYEQNDTNTRIEINDHSLFSAGG